MGSLMLGNPFQAISGASAGSVSSAPSVGDTESGATIACLSCRKRKVKCKPTIPPSDKCHQCTKHNSECTFQAHNRGRRLGSQNRKTVNNGSKKRLKLGQEDESSPSPTIKSPASPTEEQNADFAPLILVSNNKSANESDGIHVQSTLFKLKLDILPELDPVKCGFCTQEEAEELFERFFDGPTGFAGFTDPRVHTISFVQSRSCMLFIVMLWVAARHTSTEDLLNAESISTKLYEQLRVVVWPKVLVENYRSVQIVEALMLWSAFRPECEAGKGEDDMGWSFYGHGVRIAVEIGLHREFRHDKDPKARVMIRDAQRACMTLFLADRSWAAQTGRPPLLHEDNLTLGSIIWLEDDLRSPEDSSIVALIQLRRVLGRPCRTYHDFHARKQEMEQWKMEWLRPKYADSTRIGQNGGIYYHYGSLLLLGSQINSKNPPVSDIINHAISLCTTAENLTDEGFHNAHNSLWTMISFACHICYRYRTSLSPEVIEATYKQIDRLRGRMFIAGTTPAHKNGMGAVHARGLDPLLEAWAGELLRSKGLESFLSNDTMYPIDVEEGAQTLLSSQSILPMETIAQPEPYSEDAIWLSLFETPMDTAGQGIGISDIRSWGYLGYDAMGVAGDPNDITIPWV